MLHVIDQEVRLRKLLEIWTLVTFTQVEQMENKYKQCFHQIYELFEY